MATTLQIAPVNPSVEKGKTQKFTATVTGAPEGSSVEYKWEVDVQESRHARIVHRSALDTGIIY
ncbi:head outer capsid protein [Acinetobacter phage vB_AbaM_Lazarus]|uniref:Head outer capsid protein n=1 Tax=Acinetobacter phage vB_AbaM_Lazarus TaxID=2686289 RepID=A0A6B9SUZ3_9CAUD|nr:Hoc-like head decoration [Acinetobacter phage vB_AbaM_Lazarus]QHJ74118.1 head outer capsid protein [Acinetobacter phage vB_AbaM_Lazarus]